MREKISERMVLLGGVGLGAALMYTLDPDRGRRRRALVRNKLQSAAHRTPGAIEATARDLGNRVRGLAAGARSIFSGGDVWDDVLVARVRSKMGRVVSHPSAVEVAANQGRVTLRGPILANEVDNLLSSVRRVPGVTDVSNQLQVHQTADGVLMLQGGKKRAADRFESMQGNWSPSARLIAGAVGAALAIYGASRRKPLDIGLGAVGAGLLLRAATNLDIKRLIGVGADRRAVDLQRTININAPVEDVYRLWSHYDNFPRFMRNVLEVRDTGNGMSHWKVAGPAGVPVEWDAVITRQAANKIFAWKSVEGATVNNAGIIHFKPNEDGSTRVTVRLAYNPPAGAIGHALAAMLGSDPRQQMDEDMMLMKRFIETGAQPPDAAATQARARGASVR